mgnify:CR=1 FL=1
MGADVDDLIERLGELDPDERRELSSRIRADWARRVDDARRAYLERLEEEPLVGGGGMGFQPVPGEEEEWSSTAVGIRTVRSAALVGGTRVRNRAGVPNRPWVSRGRRVPTRSPRTGGRRPGEPPVAVRFSASLPSGRA